MARTTLHAILNGNLRMPQELEAPQREEWQWEPNASNAGLDWSQIVTEQHRQDIRLQKDYATEHWSEPVAGAAWWVQDNIQTPIDTLFKQGWLFDIEIGCDPEQGGDFIWCNTPANSLSGFER